MSFRNLMVGIGQAFAWVGKNMLWPATTAVCGLLWEVLCAIIRPSAKSAGEGISKAMPFILGIGVIVGGLYGLLHAPQRLQEEGVAIIALTIFCWVLWMAFKPSKKKAEVPPRQDRGGRR